MVKFETKEKKTNYLPCLIVYSDKSHVDYIFSSLINYIIPILKEKNFEPILLADKIKSGDDYFLKVSELTNDCVLGIILLDGFRPNVLFEFGMLKGKNKPVIIFQTSDSSINVHTLYKNFSESNLTQSQFKKLSQPKLDLRKHLSDFAGKHVTFVEKNAMMTDKMHISNKLKEELDKNQPNILNEVKKLQIKNLDAQSIEKIEPYIGKLVLIYENPAKFDPKELDVIHSKISEHFKQTQQDIPFNILEFIGMTFQVKALQVIVKDITEGMNLYHHAISIFSKIALPDKQDEKKIMNYVSSQQTLCILFTQISRFENRKENLNKAIISIKHSIKYTNKEKNPIFSALLHNSLGNGYYELSQITNTLENAKKAISEFNESLKIINVENSPTDFSMLQNNLGNALLTLSEVDNPKENTRLGIEALTNSLTVLNKNAHPKDFARTKMNIGVAYSQLSNYENATSNLKLSEKSLNEALEIYTKIKYPIQYAETNGNLGFTYSRLARIKNTEKNADLSIKATKVALTIFDQNNFPIDYSMAQNNLGIAYGIKAALKKSSQLFKKTINAYKEAMKNRSLEASPVYYALTEYNLGLVFGRLSELENPESNLNSSINHFKNSLIVRTKEKYPYDHIKASQSLAVSHIRLSKYTNKEENLSKAKLIIEGILSLDESMFGKEQLNTLKSLKAMIGKLLE